MGQKSLRTLLPLLKRRHMGLEAELAWLEPRQTVDEGGPRPWAMRGGVSASSEEQAES